MSIKLDVKDWKNMQTLLNREGVPVGSLLSMINDSPSNSIQKSYFAAYMLARMKANNVK